MPTFSVIIPAYNGGAFLVDCVESVFAQTCSDFELIVVDDGSTDNTADVLEPYRDRLTYVWQKNGGCAAARNHGIRLATGDYLAFFDADDVWLPEKLERQLACFLRYPEAGLVHCGHIRIEKDGTERPSRRDPAELPSGRIFKELFFRNWLTASSVVLRREAVERVGPFDESMLRAQDIEMWLRVAHEYECRAVPERLVKFRSHDASNSRSRDAVHECVMRIVQKMYTLYKDSPPRVTRAMLNAKMLEQHIKMARNFRRRGEQKKARAMAVTALKYRPWSPAAMAAYLQSLVRAE